MSDSKKPTVSEIRALQAQAIHTDEDFTQLLHTDIPYLLDLVSRMGEVIDATIVWCGDEPFYRTQGGVPQKMPEKVARVVRPARELLKEIEL